MKAIKSILLVFSIFLLLMSCRDGIQMDGPVGNYLQLDLKLPAGGDSADANRAIHADATVLVVSLTYPGKEPIVAEFPFSSQSELSIFVDKLAPANDVVLDVYLGLTADLPLTQASTTMDIKVGGNSANLTLAYNTYTVQGTLYNSDGTTLLKGQVIDIDGQTKTTDASGKFSFTVSTEDWDSEYAVFFTDVSGQLYEQARSRKSLIQNRTSFKLSAKPELFVDMTILSDSFPIKGARVGVDNGDGYEYTAVTSDANGRLLYGPVDWPHNNQSLNAIVEFNGVFVEHQFMTKGAPGAVLGTVTLDPYVIFVSHEPNEVDNVFYYLYAFDYESGTYSSMDLTDIAGVSVSNDSAPAQGGRALTDYKSGIVYIYISDSSGKKILYKLDGYSSVNLDTLDIGNITPMYWSDFSVQQMLLIEDGSKLLVVTSLGVFTVSTTTFSVVDQWDDIDLVSETAFIFNGAMEDSNGVLYALGAGYNYSTSSPIDGTQKIVRLNSNGSISSAGTLPSTYNAFSNNPYSNGGSEFASMIGLYNWDGYVMSVLTQDSASSESGGSVVRMKDWGLSGIPVNKSEFYYLSPVGILPDNRFYIVNETTSAFSGTDKKGLWRMNQPTDSDAELKEMMTDPSGSNPMFYYFNPSGFGGV